MSRNSRPRLSLPGSMLAGVVLMFAMPLSAQAASYTYINQKAPYTNGGRFNSPMLTALNLPKVGTTFKVQVPNGWVCGWSTGASYYLAFGVSNPNLPIPGMGGFLFTSAEVIVLAPGICWSTAPVTMSFSIPNSPGLLGVRFYQQVLEGVSNGNWQAPPPTYSLSRGGYGVIGK